MRNQKKSSRHLCLLTEFTFLRISLTAVLQRGDEVLTVLSSSSAEHSNSGTSPAATVFSFILQMTVVQMPMQVCTSLTDVKPARRRISSQETFNVQEGLSKCSAIPAAATSSIGNGGLGTLATLLPGKILSWKKTLTPTLTITLTPASNPNPKHLDYA